MFYCNNYFPKSKEAFKIHVKKCASIEGIVYSFANGRIVSFQDNFNFSFYRIFDFETITGDDIVKDLKIFVVSYCQIYFFCPDLNLDKIVIFRSFQQKAEEIYDLSHFRYEHVPYFDKITFYQLKDATTAVLARKKSTSLAELFSVKLKFTIDTLNNWFRNTIKTKFLELSDIKKQIFIKENPTVPSKTICCVCGFMLDNETFGNSHIWYAFILDREQLFIRNIYSKIELQSMEDIRDICNYQDSFERFIKLVPLLENSLENPRGIREKDTREDFLRYDLNNEFCHLGEVREAIDKFKVVKKFGKCDYIDKIIYFVYSNIMNLRQTENIKGTIVSEKFVDNVRRLLYNKTNIHHSHVTGNIIGYSHSYCNFKMRENK